MTRPCNTVPDHFASLPRRRRTLWTPRNMAIAGLLTLAASLALLGLPWLVWTMPCNVATLLLLDVL